MNESSNDQVLRYSMSEPPRPDSQWLSRKYRYIMDWLKRIMLDSFILKESFNHLIQEIQNHLREKATQDESKFVRIADPVATGTQQQIDTAIYAVLRQAQDAIKRGVHPVVRYVSIEVKEDFNAIGLTISKGRILWFDLTHQVLFWTLRPREGARVGALIKSVLKRLETIRIPSVMGLSSEAVRERLTKGLFPFRCNPYSLSNYDFVMLMGNEMESIHENLIEVIPILRRWMALEGQPESSLIELNHDVEEEEGEEEEEEEEEEGMESSTITEEGEKKNKRRPWTPKEVSEAKSLRKSNLSYLAIGKKMGRSKNSVKNKLTELEKKRA